MGDMPTLAAADVSLAAGLLLMQAGPLLRNIIRGVKIGGVSSEVFWFRAVATGYVLRLNSRTLQVILYY
jgi:hypothetical protein